MDILDLRNLAQVSVDLVNGLNYFHGANGAGKTAILEAVHLLARGRSFRTPQAGELVRQGQDRLVVRALVEDEHRGEQALGLSRWRRGRAELRINHAPARKLSRAAELLPLQVMGPQLSDLLFGSPSERRQWLDWGLFHVEHGHLENLRAYLHALRQRNAALKALAAGEMPPAALDGWTDELARLGETVTDARTRYLSAVLPLITETVAELAPDLMPEVRYRPGWNVEESLRKVLGESTPREVKSGVTQHGPHRAEIELRVSGLPAGSSLSRGQGKALASAMMLAQARLLRRTARRASVFLIDDIGAELDLPHSERFFRLLNELGAQVLATSNSEPDALRDLPAAALRTFHVEHGQIVAVEDVASRRDSRAASGPSEDSA